MKYIYDGLNGIESTPHPTDLVIILNRSKGIESNPQPHDWFKVKFIYDGLNGIESIPHPPDVKSSLSMTDGMILNRFLNLQTKSQGCKPLPKDVEYKCSPISCESLYNFMYATLTTCINSCIMKNAHWGQCKSIYIFKRTWIDLNTVGA